jgi:hypothetical protein
MIFLSVYGSAQNQQRQKDSVVQLYGVVMSADSLRGLDATSIIVEGTGRGTVTNSQGVFSIPVLRGDIIRFSSMALKIKGLPFLIPLKAINTVLFS